MDAFGDDFTEVPPVTESTDSADPAADFLAREQEELGELGEELGLKAPETNVIPPEDLDAFQEPVEGFVEDVPPVRSTPSPAFVMPPRPKEEPETIKKWREDQTKMLLEKDAKEAETMAELREKAKGELQEWYKRYEDTLSKTKETNRESEKEFVAEVNDISPGTEWDRVTKLCDFSGKGNKNSTKDMSRMRSILLQLKQQKNAS